MFYLCLPFYAKFKCTVEYQILTCLLIKEGRQYEESSRSSQNNAGSSKTTPSLKIRQHTEQSSTETMKSFTKNYTESTFPTSKSVTVFTFESAKEKSDHIDLYNFSDSST